MTRNWRWIFLNRTHLIWNVESYLENTKNHTEPYLVRRVALPGTTVLSNGKSSGIPCCYETKYLCAVWALNQICSHLHWCVCTGTPLWPRSTVSHSEVLLTKGSDPNPTEAQDCFSNSETQRSEASLKWEKGYILHLRRSQQCGDSDPLTGGLHFTAFNQKGN